ncbi:MAG: PAS domain S-box protein, partial [Desulfobacterales bacterium]|nr:PAS domain S-box protein [Desulfobacterales bacterium]
AKYRTLKALRESEARYQRQYEASLRAEKRARTLLDFVPYPMVYFTMEGKVVYLNPAFTEIFGWTLEELEGKRIPYVPPGLEQETAENIKKLLDEKIILRYESRRLTRDGGTLDVIMRGVVYSGHNDEPGGSLVCLRDVTHEKMIERNNKALLSISTALPAYPALEELLDFVTGVIKQLLNAEGAVVILIDEERKELFFKNFTYKDGPAGKLMKEVRFPVDKGISGLVVKTGESIIIHDLPKHPNFYPPLQEKLGFVAYNMVTVPLKVSDRIIGVLTAFNKREGNFTDTDIEMLSIIAGGVALSIENAMFSSELKEAYSEVSSLNRAKDKTINHLSHELITPVAVISASLDVLSKRLTDLPEETWKPTMERLQRNLNRILEIQYQVEDIMQDRQHKSFNVLSLLLDQCKDELEALVAGEVGEGPVTERISNRIVEIFGSKDRKISAISLHKYVKERLETLQAKLSHRLIKITTNFKPVPSIWLPPDVLQKIVDGLIKNAVENTPDEGSIEIKVQKKGGGSELVVSDRGIGIAKDNQKRIFEGFFSTQETMAYSSKRPFDFNAGGKGADLFRMKVFGEKYGFKISMKSWRCRFIPKKDDICPGVISECNFCKDVKDCYKSGGTVVNVFFPLSIGGSVREDKG